MLCTPLGRDSHLCPTMTGFPPHLCEMRVDMPSKKVREGILAPADKGEQASGEARPAELDEVISYQ